MPYYNTIKRGYIVHEQPWSSIVCLLWGPSIVQLLSEVKIFKIILPFPFPFLCYSFCLLLSSILLASPPLILWCFYGILAKFLRKFYVSSMVFLWYPIYGVSKDVSMVVLWDSYGVSKGCLWDFLWIPMGFLRYFYDISMGFLWDVHDISITVGLTKANLWYF